MKSFEEIEKLATLSKKTKSEIPGNSNELAQYVLVVLNALSDDIEKYIEKGMEAPAKRARKKTKVLAVVAKQFRIKSIKEHKY